MANRLIKHYSEEAYPTQFVTDNPPEINKDRSISELSQQDLYKLLERLRTERDAEEIIKTLRRNSGERETYEKPFVIDTKTPINQMYHHGILGMKWGVRRFQKEDGTRTPAGKKREVEASEDSNTAKSNRSKAPEGLSNDELRKLNERLQLEANFKNLTTEKIEKSESFVRKALKQAGGQALSEFTKAALLGGAKLLVKQLSPEFAEVAFNIKDKDD